MKTVSVENFISLSDSIQVEKTKVFEALAALHDDLCHLAELERGLEAERLQGVQNIRGLAHNAPELTEGMNAYNKQLVLPTQKVYAFIDSAIAIVDAANKSMMNGSLEKLPDVFNKSAGARFQEFTTGK